MKIKTSVMKQDQNFRITWRNYLVIRDASEQMKWRFTTMWNQLNTRCAKGNRVDLK
jgi:hypothetical protein